MLQIMSLIWLFGEIFRVLSFLVGIAKTNISTNYPCKKKWIIIYIQKIIYVIENLHIVLKLSLDILQHIFYVHTLLFV